MGKAKNWQQEIEDKLKDEDVILLTHVDLIGIHHGKNQSQTHNLENKWNGN